MELTSEFGTPDRLPPKPYIREGLRLEALYMLREQDLRAKTRQPEWARALPTDGIFAFQFNIDFHPTRRGFVGGTRNGAWRNIHTPSRGWHTDTDRSSFPLRGLVPVETDGLIGAGKNIGVSSVVQSAVRLHGQMIHTGQAAGTLAWLCLRDQMQPRAVAGDLARVRELQLRLCRGAGGPGVLLFPWQDLQPEDLYFEAANLLAVRGIWQPDRDSLFFQPGKIVTRRELARLVARVYRALPGATEWSPLKKEPVYGDVLAEDPDRVFVESLAQWVAPGEGGPRFSPDTGATRGTLFQWLRALKLEPDATLGNEGTRLLTRAEVAQYLWRALLRRGEWLPDAQSWLRPGGDHDGDGRSDYEDAWPFDRDNDNVPDRLQPPARGGVE
jgi:hypothetical protein